VLLTLFTKEGELPRKNGAKSPFLKGRFRGIKKIQKPISKEYVEL